jgi:HSP20 family protein
MSWDPVRDLLSMQERLENLFGQADSGWVPPVDLAELGDRYRLTIELPGLSRADVTIEFAGQVLTIRGARPAETCPDRYQQLERGQGSFSRSFRFAAAIVADATTADIAAGVLTVEIPKVALDRRRIEVS